MPLTVVSAPAQEPVTLAEAKGQCSVELTDTTTDDLLNRYIAEQREEAENYTGRALITRTYKLLIPAWPAKNLLKLPFPPVQSADFLVEYYDTNNVKQTWASENYELDTASEPAVLVPAYNKTFPSVYPRRNPIEITFKAGYGLTAASVPGPIKQAMLFKIATQFMQREITVIGTTANDIQWAYHQKLHPYRIYPIGGLEYAP